MRFDKTAVGWILLAILYSAGEALSDFIELWDEINAKRGCGWAANPFVWAIKFSLVSYQGEPSG